MKRISVKSGTQIEVVPKNNEASNATLSAMGIGLLVLILVIGAGTYYSYIFKSEIAAKPAATSTELTLTGFSQSNQQLVLSLNYLTDSIKYIQLNHVPVTLELEKWRKRAKRLPIIRGNSVIIPIKNEPDRGEYSVIIFFDNHYIELVRQSQNWLEKTFNFKRTVGYTILGRRSITTPKRDMEYVGPLTLMGRPKPGSINFKPLQVSQFNEINLAAGLLKFLWSKPIAQGPTTKSYAEFLKLTFEEKIQRVRNGDAAVMCTGFRDLFIHASLEIPNLKIRLIKAVNYAPQMPDLITYGHGTAEIWIQKLNKWVLFDPWFGVIVTQNGVPIGVEELARLRNFKHVSIVPVINALPRMYREKSGHIVFNQFFPRSLKLKEYSCETLGCSPGYADYFKNYEVREVRVIG